MDLLSEGMEMITWIIVGVLAVIAIWAMVTYNAFVRFTNRIKNSWAQIDVQLKRRADLIPNLINSVKGYMKHEKGVLTEITNARSALTKAGSVAEKARASNMITDALKSVFAVAEAYPKLQASENFMMLQEELSGTESKIAYARQFYNDMTLALNNKVEMFPSKLIAAAFNFKKGDFFETEAKDRKNVKVEF